MNWNTVNREDAVRDSFGASFESGAYNINIVEATIFRSDRSEFAQLTLKANVGGVDKFLKLVTSQADGKDGYDSKRVMQLCLLLGVSGDKITEIPTKKANTFAIPQLIGKVGCIIEYKPKIACKPSDNGEQYPEYKAVQFYEFSTGKTLNEKINKLDAVRVGEIVKELKERTYKPYQATNNTNSNNNNQSPQAFNVESNLTSDQLPF